MGQNDYFLDAARAATQRRAAADEHCGCVLHGGIVIVDLHGLSWRHIGEATIFKQIAAEAKFLAPERQRRCFIIRAPQAFAVCWRLVSPIIDPRTADRITILSDGDSLQPLLD